MKGSILIDAIIKSEHCQVGITDEKNHIDKKDAINKLIESL
jgi:hypothetical protein